MNDNLLTAKLAVQVLGWKAAPNRFMMANRAWMPSWRFAPLTNLQQAFDLLESAAASYTVSFKLPDGFTAEVRTAKGAGTAKGQLHARVITLALARALGLDGKC